MQRGRGRGRRTHRPCKQVDRDRGGRPQGRHHRLRPPRHQMDLLSGRHDNVNHRFYQGPSKTPKKGGFGQIWVNGLYYVKFNFQHDRSNFRAHWGHRTPSVTDCSKNITIKKVHAKNLNLPGNQAEISRGNLVKMPTKMLKISVMWPQWALKLLLSCWKLNFT